MGKVLHIPDTVAGSRDFVFTCLLQGSTYTRDYACLDAENASHLFGLQHLYGVGVLPSLPLEGLVVTIRLSIIRLSISNYGQDGVAI